QRAQLHWQRQDRARARADREQAVRLSLVEGRPERLAGNLVDLGLLFQKEGQPGEALARFDAALQVKPELLWVERLRAEVLQELNRPVEAGQALDRYLEQTRQPDPQALLARGLLHARAGQLPQAIDRFSARLRLSPQDTLTLGQRGWAYLQT